MGTGLLPADLIHITAPVTGSLASASPGLLARAHHDGLKIDLNPDRPGHRDSFGRKYDTVIIEGAAGGLMV